MRRDESTSLDNSTRAPLGLALTITPARSTASRPNALWMKFSWSFVPDAGRFHVAPAASNQDPIFAHNAGSTALRGQSIPNPARKRARASNPATLPSVRWPPRPCGT